MPGNYASLQGFTIPTTGRGWALIGWFPSEEDWFNIRVYPDGTQAYPGFTENQMRVGFHKQVDGAKEMWIWSPDAVSHIVHLDKPTDPTWWEDLTRSTPEGPTLSFRKKNGGQWTDKYYLNKDEFWNVFKGKVVLFNWVKD